MYLNRVVICHFTWLAITIDVSDGIHILDAIEWTEPDTDLVIYCDASLISLGFVVPSLNSAFMH